MKLMFSNEDILSNLISGIIAGLALGILSALTTCIFVDFNVLLFFGTIFGITLFCTTFALVLGEGFLEWLKTGWWWWI
jgi:hypothetical protein